MSDDGLPGVKLAPYAADDAHSQGRRFSEAKPTYRSEFQRDRDRIVHSGAFRRLEYKTQVFVNHEGDMFRTRLTHSIEVAQIGRSIARSLRINEDLTEAVALAHDLGHTPFGHAGQDALNECMKDFGGFEHNLQSLRVVDELEERYADFIGLNLTFETREGILKHCSPRWAETLGDVGRRFLHKRQPGLEAQLANLADEIAYNNHDIDDGLRAGLITIADMTECTLFRTQHETVAKAYPGLGARRVIHETIRRMINLQVTNLIENSARRIADAGVKSIDDVRAHNEPLIGFSAEMATENLELKRFLRDRLYQHYRVRRMGTKAKRVIRSLFEIFLEDVKLLPDGYRQKILETGADRVAGARIVADYIAGMTDRYAINEYNRLFDPAQLT
ncbi:MAG: deoxyguanosinetriphosphate triphosphohydrolase [Gammaproteobacteria bacterium]|nr:deoxyguanosinetriphosphate triphosphohydrolase [Gammaproteobacteria bacterium]